jgi:hypothetical protein
MWKSAAAAILFVLVLVSCATPMAGKTSSPGDGATLKEFEAIATQAFTEATRGGVPKYRVARREERTNQWSFLIVGTEEYERPGYHWIVLVDKVSKKAQVLPGQ